MDGNSSPLNPITLVLILFLSSGSKSPSHIFFSIRPYSGSSLKRCSLFRIMTVLIFWRHSIDERVKNIRSVSLEQTGSSCRKSPINIIVKPPSDSFVCPMAVSFLLSVCRVLSLMNDTSSITRICTSFHLFMLPSLTGLF